MATYKVIQDIEAEDKLVGPLSLRQFIYAGIAAVCLYLSFLMVTKGAPALVVLTLPVAGVTGFFAFPWGKDQPTEVWALAKLRFMVKPRKRVWDQTGAKELVTITAPKRVERQLTKDMNLDEVHSRLNALAMTIDSRGWAIKNVNVNLGAVAALPDTSDRLVSAASLPQVVSDVNVQASDDILDAGANPVAQHFDTMINAAQAAHRQQLMATLQQPSPPAAAPPGYWFAQPPATTSVSPPAYIDPPASVAEPQAGEPTPEEAVLAAQLETADAAQAQAYDRLKTIRTPEQVQAEAAAPAVSAESQAAIMNLASNDDFDVATLARQAQAAQADDDEIVVPLH